MRYYKLRERSVYAPKDGYRYDGIYKVVKYYPEKGKSGFIIWRYLLRRDDPEPAPWTYEGVESGVVSTQLKINILRLQAKITPKCVSQNIVKIMSTIS